jgi:HEAT repeat protein
VRQVVGRAVGEAGFRAFWKKYDKLDDKTRKSAGRAVVKILPDATRRVASLLTRGSSEDRVRAIRMARETELIEGLRPVVERLCKDHDANVRSSAVSAVGDLRPVPAELLVDRATHDGDPRVRSNAIEILESTTGGQHAKVFAERVGSEHARERATAIKALYGVAPGTAARALGEMLRDGRSEHRVSALWAVNRVKCWQRLGEVGRIAKEDPQLSVRQYALGVLKAAADEIRQERRVAV